MQAIDCGQFKSKVVELYLNATCFGVISKSQFQELTQLESAADMGEMKLIRHLNLLIERRTIRIRRIAS
tara:strand:+ start:3683 stop:3889 length:207 start_codon:yes stop_codon:yes gene_type:complete